LVGHVITNAGAGLTVNVDVHDFGTSHPLVTVKVTVAAPPQAFGAPELLFVTTGLHPPLTTIPVSHVLNLLLMVVCVWQAASVTLLGHVTTRAGAGSTVNVAVQVFGPSQSEVTVNVIEVEPPQALGAVPPELVSAPLQPPVKEAVVFQAANLLSIAVCV